MKICILTSAHPPFDGRIFYKEALSLKEAGYEVVVIAPYKENAEVKGIRIHAVPPNGSRLQRLWRLKDIYREACAEQADAYHFHDPDLIPVGLLLKKKLHKPVVYDVHEYYGDSLLTRHWLPKPLRKTTAGLVDRFEKRSARSFDAIITVNSHMAKLFRKENSEGAILHNYPLESQFDFPKPNRTKPPVILYLGAINRERGLEVILEAMVLVKQKHPEAVCELVGPVVRNIGPKYSELEAWLERGNITLRGKVPYEEVPLILEKSAIALVPLLPTLNYQKAIPVKLLEYMAAGLPVVGSKFGYIEEIIGRNDSGRLVEPGNPEDLAENIIYFLEHPEEALTCGQRGWDAFHREYTWESERKKLVSLYQRILGEN